jgi:hypothetical protein
MLYRKRAEKHNPNIKKIYKRTPKGGQRREKKKIKISNHKRGKLSCRPVQGFFFFLIYIFQNKQKKC